MMTVITRSKNRPQRHNLTLGGIPLTLHSLLPSLGITFISEQPQTSVMGYAAKMGFEETLE